jgi:hypothetical protein
MPVWFNRWQAIAFVSSESYATNCSERAALSAVFMATREKCYLLGFCWEQCEIFEAFMKNVVFCDIKTKKLRGS